MTLDSLVIRIGTIMHSKFDRISDAMTELIVQNETPLVSEELADMLASSVSGNLETVIQLLRNQIPVEEARPSTVAIRYAQLLADREFPQTSYVGRTITAQRADAAKSLRSSGTWTAPPMRSSRYSTTSTASSTPTSTGSARKCWTPMSRRHDASPTSVRQQRRR